MKDMLDEQANAFQALKAKNEKLAQQVDALDEARAVAQQEIQKLEIRLSAPRRGEPADDAGEAVRPLTMRQRAVNLQAEARRAFNLATKHALGTSGELQEYRDALDHYIRRGTDALNSDQRNSLSVGTGSEGGYWVSPDVTGRIVQKVYELDPMRSLADVQTIGSD